MKLRESLTECPVCQKRLRFRYFCRKKLQPCENPHCQIAFGMYRTLAVVKSDLAAAAEGGKTSYELAHELQQQRAALRRRGIPGATLPSSPL